MKVVEIGKILLLSCLEPMKQLANILLIWVHGFDLEFRLRNNKTIDKNIQDQIIIEIENIGKMYCQELFPS